MRQVVRAFLINDEQKFLFVRHKKGTNWVLPGGHIESGETVYKALKREIKEELNLEIKIHGSKMVFNIDGINEKPLPLAVYKIKYESKKYGYVKKLEYVFLAKIKSGDIKIQEEEIDEYRFFSKEEILKLENTFEQLKDIVKTIEL
ncbi:MAG: NUDIX hydrolase [Candidatus Gracilibacteria bacterium]|nr:NUDIX hydrolase [Candidatus Gracilibacteria bacterium]